MSGFCWDNTELCDPCFTLWMEPGQGSRRFTLCPNCPGKSGGKRWTEPDYCKTPAYADGRSAHGCTTCAHPAFVLEGVPK